MSVEVPLVLEIEKHQCLYNFYLPEYNRKDILDEAWREIADTVNLTVNECKDKWKNIRSSFLRSLKFHHGGKSKKPYYLSNYLQFILPYLKPTSNIEIDAEDLQSADEPTEETELPLDKVQMDIKVEPNDFEAVEMNFDPLTEAPTLVEDVDETVPLTRIQSRKRRRQVIATKSSAVYKANKHKRTNTAYTSMRSENGALRYFLLSLIPEFDSMTEDQIRLFKIKVMTLIDDIKKDSDTMTTNLSSSAENERLQKRLINLLLKNLEK